MAKAILVRRDMALGDCILVTPLLHRLRRIFGSEVVIHVASQNGGAAFKHNPHIDGINVVAPALKYDHVIDLNMVYERRPNFHIVDAYMYQVFGNAFWDDKQQVVFREECRVEPDIDWGKAVILHALHSIARDRSLPAYFWTAVIEQLVEAGLRPVMVGRKPDLSVSGNIKVISLVGLLNLNQLAHVISKASCFVGSDSGLIHVAGSTDVPIVGLFTSANPFLRFPWRKGILGFNCTAIVSKIDCSGCLHRIPPPVTSVMCVRKDFACIDKILPRDVVDAVTKYVGDASISS